MREFEKLHFFFVSSLFQNLKIIHLQSGGCFAPHVPPRGILPSCSSSALLGTEQMGDTSWVKPAVITHSSRANTNNGLLTQLSGWEIISKRNLPSKWASRQCLRQRETPLCPSRKAAERQRAPLISTSVPSALINWEQRQHRAHLRCGAAAVAPASSG